MQQHFTLVPTITAADNVTLARPLRRMRPRRAESERRLSELVERYGLDVRPGVMAGELSVGEQQRLEVLRALDADPQVLVLDEPTALLTDAEAALLLDVCRRLAEEGRSVVIVTHRMADVEVTERWADSSSNTLPPAPGATRTAERTETGGRQLASDPPRQTTSLEWRPAGGTRGRY